MRLPTVFLVMLAFIGTIAAPQNDKIVLHLFGIVWSHLTPYQKSGVQPVFLIHP